jgi:hypothetical protein
MGYRELSRMEIIEVVRRWQLGKSQRAIARGSGVARETVRKYLHAAEEFGLAVNGPPPSEDQVVRLVQVGRVVRHSGHWGAFGGAVGEVGCSDASCDVASRAHRRCSAVYAPGLAWPRAAPTVRRGVVSALNGQHAWRCALGLTGLTGQHTGIARTTLARCERGELMPTPPTSTSRRVPSRSGGTR